MNKKAKICLLIIIILSLCITSGCSLPIFGSAESMMHPPKATGDKGEIQNAIEEKSGTDYVLKYPNSGENRSSITMYDLNNDESEEAVALLTLNPDTDEAETHIYIIDKIDDEWTVVGDFKNHNNDVDRVEFGDINGDGMTDIMVGWSTYNINQNQLYCYLFGKDIKEINTKEIYTNMYVGKFTEENKSSIMTVTLAGTDTASVGKLLTISDKNVITSYEVPMDSEITKFTSVQAGILNKNTSGLYVDGLNTSNTYNTQVLYFDQSNRELVNPLYSGAYKGILSTSRETADTCSDYDNDGIIEIPVSKRLPYPKNKDKNTYAYQTDWSTFNISDGTLTKKQSVIINNNYSYLINIPQEWIDNGYTAYYNGDSSVLTFCRAIQIKSGPNCVQGGEIGAYIATLKKDWINIGSKQGYTKMQDVGNYTYGYKINKKTPYIFTKEEAYDIFVPKEEAEAVAVAPTEASN